MTHSPFLWTDQKLGACRNEHVRQAQVMSKLAIHQRRLLVQIHDKTMLELRHKTHGNFTRLQAL